MKFSPQKTETLVRLANGETQSSIAKDLSMARTTIWRWLKDPEFVQALDKEVRSRFKEKAGNAVNNLFDLADNADSETVKLNANKEILDRAGYSVKHEIDVTNTNDIVVEFVNPNALLEQTNEVTGDGAEDQD